MFFQVTTFCCLMFKEFTSMHFKNDHLPAKKRPFLFTLHDYPVMTLKKCSNSDRIKETRHMPAWIHILPFRQDVSKTCVLPPKTKHLLLIIQLAFSLVQSLATKKRSSHLVYDSFVIFCSNFAI